MLWKMAVWRWSALPKGSFCLGEGLEQETCEEAVRRECLEETGRLAAIKGIWGQRNSICCMRPWAPCVYCSIIMLEISGADSGASRTGSYLAMDFLGKCGGKFCMWLPSGGLLSSMANGILEGTSRKQKLGEFLNCLPAEKNQLKNT